MMLEMAGRRLKVLSRTKAQTVRIPTEEGVRGRYQSAVRLTPPFVTADGLVAHGFGDASTR